MAMPLMMMCIILVNSNKSQVYSSKTEAARKFNDLRFIETTNLWLRDLDHKFYIQLKL